MPSNIEAAAFKGSGVFNIVKAPGPTSQDVVSDVKRILKAGKVGHTGTLDPGAAGVLPICVGKATRLFDYLVDKDKEYRCEILFGVQTDTLDSYGEVLRREDVAVEKEELVDALSGFLGESIQEPPMYSALKVNGKKMYQRAREGGDSQDFAEMRRKKARAITISSIEYLAQTGPNRFLFDVKCSRGTYVRVLCEDIARQLSTIATMSFLLRQATGPFRVEQGITLDELGELAAAGRSGEAMIPMDQALAQLPAVELGREHYRALENGNKIPMERMETPESSVFRLYCGGDFFGVGERRNNVVQMRTLLKENTD